MHNNAKYTVIFFFIEKRKQDMNVFYYKKPQNQTKPLLDSNETEKQNKTKLYNTNLLYVKSWLWFVTLDFSSFTENI